MGIPDLDAPPFANGSTISAICLQKLCYYCVIYRPNFNMSICILENEKYLKFGSNLKSTVPRISDIATLG